MEYRYLGRSGLKVSVLAMGTMTIGGKGWGRMTGDLGVREAADLALSEEDLQRLDAVSRPPLLYPYWHQKNTAGDRLGPADLSLLAAYLDDTT